MGGSIQFRTDFVKSNYGIIKIIEIVLGALEIYLVGFYCSGSQCFNIENWFSADYWWHGLAPTVIFLTFVINIALYILHLLNVPAVCDCCSWKTAERIYSAIATVLLIIGMILETITLVQQNWAAQLIAGVVFGWLLVICFLKEAHMFQRGTVDGYQTI